MNPKTVSYKFIKLFKMKNYLSFLVNNKCFAQICNKLLFTFNVQQINSSSGDNLCIYKFYLLSYIDLNKQLQQKIINIILDFDQKRDVFIWDKNKNLKKCSNLTILVAKEIQ